MPLRFFALTLSAACFLLSFIGCTHTPPGTSVELALARRPDVVRMPTPVIAAAPAPAKTAAPSSVSSTLPPPEKTEQIAEAYSRAEFCMAAGKDAEAIAGYRDAVKLDANFADAWNKLAALYEKTGQDKQAMDAFRRAKSANGTHPNLVSNSGGALPLP